MLHEDDCASGVTGPPPSVVPSIQFYSIEVSPMADGRVYVGVRATICESDGELDDMELGSDRVDTLDEALALIRRAVALRN